MGPHVVIAAHDHLYQPLPHAFGVQCTVMQSTDCAVHPLVCDCPYRNGQSATLRTCINGSKMAGDVTRVLMYRNTLLISEYAFSMQRFLWCVEMFQQRHQMRIGVRLWRPFQCAAEAHWLLQSLVFVALESEQN